MPPKDTSIKEVEKVSDDLVCGIIMPISAFEGCSEAHWGEVQEILTDAIEAAKFSANIVSSADEIGIIHKRIIQNLYSNPVVVCDVSGKNPNVMFELGIRLAFDKPTIIVKDDKTSYTFDTSPIEHLEYPRDLRFSKIVEFKEELTEKIKATYKKAQTDKNYTTFLKHFGAFKVAEIETQTIPKGDFIIEELKALRHLIVATAVNREAPVPPIRLPRDGNTLCFRSGTINNIQKASEYLSTLNIKLQAVPYLRTSPNHFHIPLEPNQMIDKDMLLKRMKEINKTVRWL